MFVAIDFVAFGSAVALVIGYAVLFALWWFVFRGRGKD
jgi:hypothetical protein